MESPSTSTVFQCPFCLMMDESEEIVISHIRTHENSQSGSAENSPATFKGKFTNEMVLLLISLYKKHQEKFNNINFTTKRVWTIISEEMRANNYLLTGGQCDDKWRNLKKTFKSINDAANSTGGAARKKWPFFLEMQDALGHRPDVEPVASFESSDGVIVTREAEDTVPSPTTPVSSKRKRPAPDWFEEYGRLQKVRAEAKAKRHEERMLLKREAEVKKDTFRTSFLDIMRNLKK